MAIKKTKTAKYQIDVRDVKGSRRRKTFGTKYEAETALREIMVNRSKGLVSTIDRNLTLTKSCMYFLENYASLYCKEKTYDEYNRMIMRDIIPYFQNIKLHLLTKVQIELFIQKLRNERNLSNCTLNKYVILLRSIINKQIENDNIFQNVASKIPKLPINSKKGRAFEKEELEIIVRTCKEKLPKFFPMLYTAIYTGMRRGELCALAWEDIDFENNKIHVVHSTYKNKLTTTKTKTSVRYIDMIPSLKAMLLKYRTSNNINGIYVFPNAKGGLLDSHNVSNRWVKKLVELCNIGNFSLHDFRHTYATHLTKECGDIQYVQSQLGHASAKVTMDVYGHLLKSNRDTAINLIEKNYAIKY